MAADPDGGTRRDGHLPPLPCTGKPTATSRASGGSSSRRFEASRGAACHADDAEGMSKKMALAEGTIGGRSGHYCHLSSSSCGSHATPLTHHHPASPPVSSRGGGNNRKTHGGGDASSFITPLLALVRVSLVVRTCTTPCY